MVADPFASLPDPQLIEACLDGQSQAWEALIVRYQRLIYSIPVRYGLPEHDANDVFQNVSLLLLQNLSRLRDRQRLGAWLVITTRRECWRMLRQRQQLPLQAGGATSDLPLVAAPYSEDELLALERQTLVRAAVDLLDGPCRELLTLLFYTEPRPTYSAVAKRLGIPEGSIGPTRARCLEKLMKILDEMGFSEV
jgi:RNA polymerase sigma factor (sigma-70 family)